MRMDRITTGIIEMDSFHWLLCIRSCTSERADAFTRSRTMMRNGSRTSRNGEKNTQLKQKDN